MAARYNAIVIDDDPDICDLCTDYLENTGMFKMIVSAGDGVTATNKLANQRFDVILLDLNIPKKNGIKILSQIKEMKNQEIGGIVIISGELDKAHIQEAVALGAKNFIVKPFDEDAIKSKVLQILKNVKLPKTIE